MKQDFNILWILVAILFTLNFAIFTTEFGVYVTKSHNLLQHYSTLGKSVRIMTISYIKWCYNAIDMLISRREGFKQEVTGLSILGPVRNKGT